MGATSGRGILGHIKNGKLETETIHRFTHEIVDDNGRKRWQWDKIINEITGMILDYKDEISSIGIDTWGVDFALLDKDFNIMENPISYRDNKNELGFKEALKKLSAEEIFLSTGNQLMPINSLFQLYTYKLLDEKKFNEINKLVFLPDFINYLLTGNLGTEMTIASTSQILDIRTQKWSEKILETFGINKDIFPDFIENKVIIGNTKNSKIAALKNTDINVISVASHDTASAVYLTEAYRNKDYAFISSGTWSLIGCCTDEAYISKEVFAENITNEVGFNSKNLFLKNITGLYLIERLREELSKINERDYSFGYIKNKVNYTKNFQRYLDTEFIDLTNEEISIIESIEKYLTDTNQKVLDDKEEYFKIIYEGLIFKYKENLDEIEKITKNRFKGIHIIGGGSKADFFCQMISDGLNMKVIAGPDEATAMGNILAQLSAIDKNIDLDKVIKNSYEKIIYNPINYKDWEKVDII